MAVDKSKITFFIKKILYNDVQKVMYMNQLTPFVSAFERLEELIDQALEDHKQFSDIDPIDKEETALSGIRALLVMGFVMESVAKMHTVLGLDDPGENQKLLLSVSDLFYEELQNIKEVFD